MLHQVLQVLILVSCLLVEVLWFHRYLSYFHYFHNFLTLIFFWLLSASPFSSKLVFAVGIGVCIIGERYRCVLRMKVDGYAARWSF